MFIDFYEFYLILLVWQKHKTPLCRRCRGWAGQQREYDKECKQATDGKQSGQLHDAIKIAGCAAWEEEMRWFIQTNDTSFARCLLLEPALCHAMFLSLWPTRKVYRRILMHRPNRTEEAARWINSGDWSQINAVMSEEHKVLAVRYATGIPKHCEASLWLSPEGILDALKFCFAVPKSLFTRNS